MSLYHKRLKNIFVGLYSQMLRVVHYIIYDENTFLWLKIKWFSLHEIIHFFSIHGSLIIFIYSFVLFISRKLFIKIDDYSLSNISLK